ncbi:hypothetical protein [Pyruvatibacter sp.]
MSQFGLGGWWLKAVPSHALPPPDRGIQSNTEMTLRVALDPVVRPRGST